MCRPITPRILSRELKELEHRGLINRKAYPVVPRRVEYSLTDRGRALLPILSEIIRWGATGAHEEILGIRSEEHTSELKSLMRISYAVFCLNKTKQRHNRA